MKRIILGAFALTCLLACGAGAAAAADQDARSTACSAMGYRLGAGDRVKVTTYGEDALTGEFDVDSDGNVALPLGSVKAKDLTPGQFQAAVETALESHHYMQNPHVSVSIINTRPFFILGEVNHPGQYPYPDLGGLSIDSAVATAAGYTYRANIHKVKIKRPGENIEHTEKITPCTMVYPGDTVKILERFF